MLSLKLQFAFLFLLSSEKKSSFHNSEKINIMVKLLLLSSSKIKIE